jgi:hypothetical protein
MKQKKFIHFLSKFKFTYPYAFKQDVQATREAFRPQKRTPIIKKMKFITLTFSIYLGNFCLLGSGSRDPIESGSGNIVVLYFKKLEKLCQR